VPLIETQQPAKVRVVQLSRGAFDYYAGKIQKCRDEFEKCLKEIKAYSTISDFQAALGTRCVSSAIARLVRAQALVTHGIDGDMAKKRRIDEWAKQVMLYLREVDDCFDANAEHWTAVSLDSSRKVCLELLYSLVDRVDKSELHESELNEFKYRNIQKILDLCLPMDRAKCPYFNWYGPESCYGMAWYSQEDLNKFDFWNGIHEKYGHGPTINNRLVRLIKRLPSQSYREVIYRWIKPEKAPWMTDDQDRNAS
jgi:hypothetical protein